MPAPASLAPAIRHRAGIELPASALEGAEARGFSFTHVRVHHDDVSHRLAKDLGARAFVAGQDIFFRAGQYAPFTTVGRELLVHELDHLPEAESDAEHVYRAPFYDTTEWTAWNFPEPPPTITVAHFRQQIQQNRMSGANPAITSFQISGATTTEQEIFLLNIIWCMSRRDGWDSVTQVAAQIGWPQAVSPPTPSAPPTPTPSPTGTPPPPRPTQQAPNTAPSPTPSPTGTPSPSPRGTTQGFIIPTGVVRFSIDAQGAARAELLSIVVGVSPAAALSDSRATVESRLQTEFGISQIVDRGASWSDAELRDVLGALTMLTGADRNALRGISLVRVNVIPGGFSGQYSPGGGVAPGGTQVARVPELRLASSAFRLSSRVLGDPLATVPSSFQTILHEVGHAVEDQPHRAASERETLAGIRANRAVEVNNAALEAWRTAHAGYRAGTVSRADLDASQATYDTAHAAYTTARGQFTAARSARQALEVPDTIVAPTRTAATAADTAFRQALRTATTAAAAYAQPVADESLAYRNAVDAMTRAVERYDQGRHGSNRLTLEQAVLAAQTARNAARTALQGQNSSNTALTDFVPVDTAQDAWWEAKRMFAETSGRTRRLQRFVDLVTQNNIVPLTTYARQNWPYRPGEFYAETYALWHTDRNFLQTHYPALFTFFDSGAYLQ